MRRSILLAAALTTTLALAACSSGDSGDDSTTEPEETSSTGSLTVWVDETRIDVFKELAAQFKEEKGVDVKLVQKASGDIREEFVQQVPTGKGPDVVIGAHDWTGEFVTNGVVQPVELGDKAAEFSDVSVSAFTYDGAVYGVPYAVENIALVRNNQLASETPATFDELVAQNATTGAQYPIIIQQGDEGDAYHLYPLQTSFGAPVFVQNEDGSYSTELGLGGEQGTAFANYLAKLGAEKVLDPAIDGEKAKQAFLDGQSPYIVTGPWYATEFTDAGMDISVLPVPSAGGEPAMPFVGVQGAFISAKTQNAVLANEFVVNFLGTQDVQLELAQAGGRAPALTAAAEMITDPIMTQFAEAAGTAPMPSIPEMGSVWQFWGTTEVQIISGQAADPAAAWQTMVDNIQSAIDAG
ncbi:maltose ABC transporter substrate-binding protein [Cellulosimicrobium cellulans]|jgi:arabinogalactan oligomer/maltooligosaccharide transport system substrate-binding protein|uniref:Maltose ABC transporter substrate-binding protein n=1 Tax=Cellulosimicrobium cellulans TaxID=1710 RepID=A0A1Y0HS86_CELCE|nr:maltose ABC transporter substrate-binding protein [Cellulosimicrobium cellulans]ARU50174.1 maltose ABC transporter substrate-binding protein [Cellulosimicrobium cellulans]